MGNVLCNNQVLDLNGIIVIARMHERSIVYPQESVKNGQNYYITYF